MTKNLLALPIGLSPLLLLLVLFETSANQAYAEDADSIGIPLFHYLLFVWPISLALLTKVPNGSLRQVRLRWWNGKRIGFSVLTLVVTVFPIGLFWVGLLLVSLSSGSFGSVAVSLIMLAAILLVRAYSLSESETGHA